MRSKSNINWPDNRTNQAHFLLFGGPITVLLYIYTKGYSCLGKDSYETHGQLTIKTWQAMFGF